MENKKATELREILNENLRVIKSNYELINNTNC